MKRRKMLPAYQRLQDENGENGYARKDPLFTISFAKFSTITVALPLFSFIFCVVYSLIFFFEQSTSTHCHVWNYLPSISVSEEATMVIILIRLKCYCRQQLAHSSHKPLSGKFQLLFIFFHG